MEAPPQNYIAYRSLTGDKSDNIPRLVSDKKALQYCNDPELFRKFMAVEENRANFSVNRQLIEFRAVPPEEIILQEGTRNFAKLKEEFGRMAFESIINYISWLKYTKTFDCLRY
jgi:5'-3' exonuclease